MKYFLVIAVVASCHFYFNWTLIRPQAIAESEFMGGGGSSGGGNSRSLDFSSSLSYGRSPSNTMMIRNEWWDYPHDKIRSWGCDLKTGPFVFVHIGKAGGGNVRARIAASSLNYTKDKWSNRDGSYYYPMVATGEEEEEIAPAIAAIEEEQGDSSPSEQYTGRFCNSEISQSRPNPQKTFEGTTMCHGVSPIAQAVA